IITKLQECGWEEEFLKWTDGSGLTLRKRLEFYKLLSQPRPLTDCIWRRIAPPLHKFLSSEKVEFLKHHRHTTYNARFDVLLRILSQVERHLPHHLVMPPIFYLVSLDPLRSIIEDLPIEAGSDPTIFDTALETLQSMIQQWNDQRTDIVLGALQVSRPESTKDDLFLACSLFRCANPECNSHAVYSYPVILRHFVC
ncbi:hypothetical protein L218DRAFT_839415, partial [Marasmius fiardii PR-910]